MTNDRANDNVKNLHLHTEAGSDQDRHPYHNPTLVHYGNLAELVQIHPALGSDGGIGDCQHI
jgi:hypothetical protein